MQYRTYYQNFPDISLKKAERQVMRTGALSLPTEESQAKRYGCNQSRGVYAGTRLLSYAKDR
ncbi:hypothetical protein GCM10011396_37960 [Undibacterium terreum]|uniref:Uncharacterized protein n=1 Tax=Undibacterium terreum TaxID=1224302 RepID=A0A916UTG6_9BURK|nr:hypothetical protein GCM10011396_37960 [Undibacterium terreum]